MRRAWANRLFSLSLLRTCSLWRFSPLSRTVPSRKNNSVGRPRMLFVWRDHGVTPGSACESVKVRRDSRPSARPIARRNVISYDVTERVTHVVVERRRSYFGIEKDPSCLERTDSKNYQTSHFLLYHHVYLIANHLIYVVIVDALKKECDSRHCQRKSSIIITRILEMKYLTRNTRRKDEYDKV